MRSRGEGSIRQRTRADGSTVWEARVTIHGRRVSFYDEAKSTAQARARQARADAERGITAPSSGVTVAEYLDGWLVRVRPTVRARTHDDYRQIVADHIDPVIGRTRLVDLAPGHVTAMLARVVASGLSEARARRVRVVLSSALHAAQLDLGLARNAAALARMPKSDRPTFVPETIPPAQAAAILAAFDGRRLWPLVAFSIATGVRLGELLALRWHDVDTEARTVTITHAVDVQDGRRVLARPKTDRAQRTIALAELATRALAVRREQEAGDRLLAGRAWRDLDLVFPNPNGDIRDRCVVRRGFQERLAAVGLPVIRWHALRRVFAALLQDQGVPLERIRDLMGHSTLRVTEGYAYTLPERLAGDVRAVDSALDWGTGGVGGSARGPEGPEIQVPPGGFEPPSPP